MPRYEFKCARCGAREVLTLPIEWRDRNYYCECGSKLTRVFNLAGIVFKGAGFYHNDSRPKEKSEDGKT